MKHTLGRVSLLAAILLGVTTPLLAQGAVASGNVSAASGDGSTGLAFSGSVGYRFNRALGLGVELTRMNDLGQSFADVPDLFIAILRDRSKQHATMFTTNVRLEIPTTTHRVIPFAIGGAGVAAVTHSYTSILSSLNSLLLDPAFNTITLPGADFSVIVPTSPATTETTSTVMALTLGGGASFLVTDHMSIDVDLRVVRFLSDQAQTFGRFGGGVSYRF